MWWYWAVWVDEASQYFWSEYPPPHQFRLWPDLLALQPIAQHILTLITCCTTNATHGVNQKQKRQATKMLNIAKFRRIFAFCIKVSQLNFALEAKR